MLLVFTAILIAVAGSSFFLGRYLINKSELIPSPATQTSNFSASVSPSPLPSLFSKLIKRFYSSQEKISNKIKYPEEMVQTNDSDLYSLQCSLVYYADDDLGYYVYREDPRAEMVEMKDEELYNFGEKLYTDLSILAYSYRICKVEDGRAILQYEKPRRNGSINNTVGIVISNTDASLEKITEIPSDGGPYFSCTQTLQLTKSEILWLECGVGDGGYGSESVYKVDLKNKISTRVVKCDYNSSLNTNNGEPEINCQ